MHLALTSWTLLQACSPASVVFAPAPKPFPVPFCFGPKISETVKPFTTRSPHCQRRAKSQIKGLQTCTQEAGIDFSLASNSPRHLQPASWAPWSSFPIIMEITRLDKVPALQVPCLQPSMKPSVRGAEGTPQGGVTPSMEVISGAETEWCPKARWSLERW